MSVRRLASRYDNRPGEGEKERSRTGVATSLSTSFPPAYSPGRQGGVLGGNNKVSQSSGSTLQTLIQEKASFRPPTVPRPAKMSSISPHTSYGRLSKDELDPITYIGHFEDSFYPHNRPDPKVAETTAVPKDDATKRPRPPPPSMPTRAPPPAPELQPRRGLINDSDLSQSRPNVPARDNSQSPSRIPRRHGPRRASDSSSDFTLQSRSVSNITSLANSSIRGMTSSPLTYNESIISVLPRSRNQTKAEVIGQNQKMNWPKGNLSSKSASPRDTHDIVFDPDFVLPQPLIPYICTESSATPISQAFSSTLRNSSPEIEGSLKARRLTTSTGRTSLAEYYPSGCPKKLIIILDATQQSSRPVPAEGSSKRPCPPRTNLKRLSDSLAARHKDTGMPQLVYYVSGTGNEDDFGLNQSLHTTILEAYTYLSDNWVVGDEICLFGFSHGAFAVRALAGLLTEIGLFNKAGMANFDELYDTYFDPKYGKTHTTQDYQKWRDACEQVSYDMTRLEGATLHKVSIKFLGCLDTTGWSNFQDDTSDIWYQDENERLWKQGFFNPRHLLLNEEIEYAAHALALDEVRETYAPLLMFRAKKSVRPLHQVWFTGSHLNIGGGQFSYELKRSNLFRRPDRNELSDIVFLWLITECHQVLTFSKKHINMALAGYVSDQPISTSSQGPTDRDQWENRWVAAKIEEPWGVDGSFFSLVRSANPMRIRHNRTPLRYRPHWFEDEQWRSYTSCESIHASSRYRQRLHSSYTPKALADYHCTTTFEKFGPPPITGRRARMREAAEYLGPKLGEEQYYYRGIEKPTTKLYTEDLTLPITTLTTFEVLSTGGADLISAFGLSMKDLNRVSPPVFRYSGEELRSIQEDWVLELGSQPLLKDQGSSSVKRLSLRHPRSFWSLKRISKRGSRSRSKSADNLRKFAAYWSPTLVASSSSGSRYTGAMERDGGFHPAENGPSSGKQKPHSSSFESYSTGTGHKLEPNSFSEGQRARLARLGTTSLSQLTNRGNKSERIYDTHYQSDGRVRDPAGDANIQLGSWQKPESGDDTDAPPSKFLKLSMSQH
ncbi:hypothetical protein Dda_5203 [Drechslerella dactyloides]|uniref:T6SS Phospholipase effector Tle1-like catalytic domain-containing protein n=1 Tax=Drechslerella dactyloides TaxID=74499 RepID=A0AAD6IW58_DREDA|nr:hypothetical protein Dda_5203 [Drechslerella dactyloides]